MTNLQNQFDKEKFADEAVQSFKNGEILEWLRINRYFQSHGEYENICGLLVELHNDEKIDLVSAMQRVSNNADQGHYFWSLQSLFSKIIPHLIAQPDALMDGVLRLVKAGGRDLAANQPNAAFRKWLKVHPEETRRLLERAKQPNEPPLKLLTFILEAGAIQDFKNFLNAALDFLSSENDENRLAAITALSRIEMGEDDVDYKRCIEALLSNATNAEDMQEVAQTIGAILDVHAKRSEVDCENIITAIKSASRKPTPDLHYLMAQSLGFHANKFSRPLKEAIIKALEFVNPSLKGVIDQVDFAFSVCIGEETRAPIASCLETLLANQEAPLEFGNLDVFTHKLTREKSDDFAWLVTYWLRYGSHEARLCLPYLFSQFAEDGHDLVLSFDDFDFSDDELVFISKKAMGYLLFNSEIAASILISCLNSTSTDEAAEEISNLLFDPLMINFSGQARHAIEAFSNVPGGKERYLKQAIKAHDEYLEGLRSLYKVPELRPSASERRTQAERQRQLFVRSFKDAEKDSVLLHIAKKQTILYGSGSVHYLHTPDGKLHRSESYLSSHTTSFEIPRFQAIDPVCLQNIILRFRNEKLTNETVS